LLTQDEASDDKEDEEKEEKAVNQKKRRPKSTKLPKHGFHQRII
jgi:hypothetical protein